ncbi:MULTISPECIES: wax ester/triacylglycerol synthase family O-acyltransferase [unclassified Mycobacterium]|uniref:WS/DGAT/MGAT family O-acyltransferase n=1 Tax=unclassified Mycobacterium TaxID=2642494 RepID=UPI0007FEC3BB|nr:MULTISPECIES: wax ester/triacylglycerol synthase family O-acyltransferase [unclassified Mycobacterium]OBH08008.1 diacylglycerol O-acyltransferase [Mycobacterium sp. E2699]OBI56179.1 diacylglycerol O-acyltransferase [Mycobacterium sp. E787]
MAVLVSPADAVFLVAETPNRPMHVGALALLSPPDGARPGFVRDEFAAALDRDRVAPLWRRRPRRSAGSLGRWYWHTDAAVDLDYHVQVGALRRPGARSPARNLLWDRVSELHAEPLDRSRPLWQMHVIEGLGEGQYALYLKIHHALADGVSTMRLLRQTVGPDPDRRGMPALWEVTGGAPGAGIGPLAAARRALGAARDLASVPPALADTAWRAVRRRGGPLTVAAPRTPFTVAIEGARCFAGRSFPIDRLRLVAKHTDATLNDVVLAMCGGALRRYLLARHALPGTSLMATVPVSLRGDEPVGPPDPVPGNKIGTLACCLGTHLADPAERLAAVQASMREGKAALTGRNRVQVLAMSALGAAPLALAVALGRAAGPLRPPNVMISNVRGPEDPLYWNGARFDALYPLSVVADGQALNITCTSINHQVSFGLTGCRRAVPRIDALADALGRELDLLDAFHRIRRARPGGRRGPRRRPV